MQVRASIDICLQDHVSSSLGRRIHVEVVLLGVRAHKGRRRAEQRLGRTVNIIELIVIGACVEVQLGGGLWPHRLIIRPPDVTRLRLIILGRHENGVGRRGVRDALSLDVTITKVGSQVSV